MVFWDTVANNKRRHASQAPHEVAEAYIQPAPYRTDETVKFILYGLVLGQRYFVQRQVLYFIVR